MLHFGTSVVCWSVGQILIHLTVCLNFPLKNVMRGLLLPYFALKLGLNFRVFIQPYSSGLLNSFCEGGRA